MRLFFLLIFIWLRASLLLCHGQDIFESVKSGSLTELKKLVDNNKELVNLQDETGKTPLSRAVMMNKPELTAYLLGQGADPLKREISENVALYYAARYGYAECAKLLLDYGTPVDIANHGRSTALMIVCGREGNGGSIEVTRLLIERGAAIDGPSGSCMPLRMAARKGYLDIVDYLLDNGAGIPDNNTHRSELLLGAVRGGMTKLFDALIEHGVKPVLSNENGVSLLHEACNSSSSHTGIVEKLLATGSGYDVIDNYGYYPIHYAAARNNSAIVSYLLEHGDDINTKTGSGQSVYMIAVENQAKEVAELLVEQGADTLIPRCGIKNLAEPDISDGSGPAVLAPGIISVNRNAHGVVSFSPEEDEVYWQRDGRIMYCRKEKKGWTQPAYVPFIPMDEWCDVPFVAPDNSGIYFTSRKPMEEGQSNTKENIWFAERDGISWKDPVPLPEPVNNMQLHWQVSVNMDGTVYFGARRGDSFGQTDIYLSRKDGNAYCLPENAGPSINTAATETCPYISPDGSYIIFTRIDSKASVRVCLYISFRTEQGKWTKAKCLDEYIPFRDYGLCTHVSPDGKYIFYLDNYGNNNTIYYFDASFIEKLRKEILY